MKYETFLNEFLEILKWIIDKGFLSSYDDIFFCDKSDTNYTCAKFNILRL